MKLVSIQNIIIPEGRRRLGDIDDLAESIQKVGLLNPISINENNILIAGHHRLKACMKLGWNEIPAIVREGIDELDAELAEIDENLMRNELIVLERAEQLKRRKEIYEIKYPETKKGISQSIGMNEAIGNNVRTQNILTFTKDTSKKSGLSQSTIKDYVKIADKLDDEVKEKIRDTSIADSKTDLLVLTKFDHEKQKEIAYKIQYSKAKNVRQAIISINKELADELRKRPILIPTGRYTTIEVDPPWKLDGEEGKSQVLQYPLMELNEIKAMRTQIDEIADENCHLYLWCINPMLKEAFEVLEAWGFVYKTCITWVKSNGFGTGHYYRGATEHVLFGVRGRLDTLRKDQANYFEAPRYRHSEKPNEFYKIAESMSPGPRIRLFARRKLENWVSWGNEA